jgi:hypothetical protein
LEQRLNVVATGYEPYIQCTQHSALSSRAKYSRIKINFCHLNSAFVDLVVCMILANNLFAVSNSLCFS